MSCCNPCGCSWRIIDTSKPKEVVPDPDPPVVVPPVVEPDPPVVEPDPPVVEPDPPPVEMCVTYVFHPPTELWVKQLVPCNELP